MHLRSTFVTADPMYRRVVADSAVLTWRGGQFAQGSAARMWLTPAGYRNGFSLPVLHAQLGEIGSIHANSYASDFGDQQLEAAEAFSAFLGVVLSQKAAQDGVRLTPRELHVVRLVAEGASNPEIAEQLCVSRRTVATHVENILRKLGTRSRVGIAMEGARLGLI
ncbi:response regulator transcription factor [Leucobacter sp. CSA1]|uniref:Response regulator transcription factor n=2 Tax=Leucobacter chromiisoli TaxID=2796471 RepID=A0A934QBF1_9MICO|nr:response regulator transcription factor [Leucobacter chromiisoli]